MAQLERIGSVVGRTKEWIHIREINKSNSDIIFGYAGVAQTVEQLIRNEKVEGSIPFTGTSTQAGLQAECLQTRFSYLRHVPVVYSYLSNVTALSTPARLVASCPAKSSRPPRKIWTPIVIKINAKRRVSTFVPTVPRKR